jgi:peptidoglycan/xylan/chitin deacetylase (PgdA/CDA1 family)
MGVQGHGRTLAILGFHKIGPAPDQWETWFYVPRATFVSYLDYLKEDGWQVLDVAAFLRGLAEPDSLPERAALITFDDGYRSILDYGLPELRFFSYPAVMFVPTAFIGGHNDFDADNEPKEAICSWEELRELERSGVSVQSHAVSHRAFSRLNPAEQAQELLRSKAALEDGLAKPVEVFSYPYGDCGPEPRAARPLLERTGYLAACLYGGGPQRVPVADPYRLARLAVGPDTDLRRCVTARPKWAGERHEGLTGRSRGKRRERLG